MRVGLTGGTGFLGRSLSARLLERGNEVVVFTRSLDRARSTVPTGVQLKRWRLMDEPLAPATLDSLDAVVHLAGEPVAGIWTAEKRQRIFESRIRGTRNLLEGWRRAKTPPAALLSSSASGFYGDGGDEELTETSAAGKGFLARVCREWEAEAREVQPMGTRLVLLRTSLPLDRRGGLLAAMLPAFRLGLGGRIGSGRQWMPWIHLEDWVSLVLLALDQRDLSGPLNVTGPNPVRNATFTETLARVLRRPAFLRVPGFALKLALREAAEELALSGQRVVPALARDRGFSFQFPDLEPALRDVLRG